mmetsp:Transcript_134275/g.417311  ORF Transcript_134275/g.417311 Transcript_134275/m.417311 type:complete len:229 (+) Transcript_134275:52-738(+)
MHLPASDGGRAVRKHTLLAAALFLSPPYVAAALGADSGLCEASSRSAAPGTCPARGISASGLQLVQVSTVTRRAVVRSEHASDEHAGGGTTAGAASPHRSVGSAAAAFVGAASPARKVHVRPEPLHDATAEGAVPTRASSSLLSSLAQRLRRSRGFGDSAGDIVAVVLLVLLVLFLLLLYGKNWNVKEAVQEVQEDPRHAFRESLDTGADLYRDMGSRRQVCAQQPCC